VFRRPLKQRLQSTLYENREESCVSDTYTVSCTMYMTHGLNKENLQGIGIVEEFTATVVPISVVELEPPGSGLFVGATFLVLVE